MLNIKEVGLVIKINNINSKVIMRLVLFNILIFLFSLEVVEIKNNIVIMVMMIIWDSVELGILNK